MEQLIKMNTKDTIDIILKVLAEETKKVKKKKKKKHPLVATPILRRPMGSIFYMDAGVSVAESINEGYGQKPVTKKFNNLKWKLNDFQKQFLDDFISIPENVIKNDDLIYASKRTGIPVESIKSIRNTYADKKSKEQIQAEMRQTLKDLGLAGGMLDEKMIEDANSTFTQVRDLPKNNSGKSWSMNPNPEFRNQSLHQSKYEDALAAEVGGGLNRKFERELPGYMYEWLLYFIEGSEKFKITESKLMNDFHSNKFDKYKFVLFSFDVSLKESKAHAYDNASTNSKLKELEEFNEKINEYNTLFGTNFIIANQYTGNDGFLKVVMENAQITDGKNIYNRKFINMEDNDIKKAISLGFYDDHTPPRSITE